MLRDLAIWRDSLYVCGYFDQIDGQPINQVAQYLGALPGGGTATVTEEPAQALAAPGTHDGGLSWELALPQAAAWQWRLSDAAGREVQRGSLAADRMRISLHEQPPGIYLLQVSSPGLGVRYAKLHRP
jgi:hypothetical protein